MRDRKRRGPGDGSGGAGRDGGGGGEPWLADLLRAEADGHEPDLAAVRRRVAAGSGGAVPGTARTASARAPERPASRTVPGQRRGAAWAAAGFVLATTAGGLAVAAVSGVLAAGGHSTGPVRVVPNSATPGTGPPAGATAPPPASATATTPPAPSAPPPTVTGEPLSTVSPPARVPPAPGALAVTAAAAGRAVDVTAGRDWLVAGPHPDATVRSGSGGQVVGGPHVVGDPRTAVAAGPFRTSWTGGSPAATGSGVATWRTVAGRPGGPRTGFLVSAPSGASSLTLYVGAGASGALVTVTVGGEVRDAAPLPPGAGGALAGHVVTVRLGGDPAADRAEVLVDAPGGGVVAFAAAVLR